MQMYKAVDKRDTRLTSWLSRGYAEVTYKPGVRAEAPEWLVEMGYHLFCMETVKECVEMLGPAPDGSEVWECEAEEEVKLPPYADNHYANCSKTIIVVDGTWPRASGWQQGSRMFRYVTLTRKVEDALQDHS